MYFSKRVITHHSVVRVVIIIEWFGLNFPTVHLVWVGTSIILSLNRSVLLSFLLLSIIEVLYRLLNIFICGTDISRIASLLLHIWISHRLGLFRFQRLDHSYWMPFWIFVISINLVTIHCLLALETILSIVVWYITLIWIFHCYLFHKVSFILCSVCISNTDLFMKVIIKFRSVF